MTGFLKPLHTYVNGGAEKKQLTSTTTNKRSSDSELSSTSVTAGTPSEDSESEAERLQRMYVNLNLFTETGRLACRQPNLQNIPTGKKYNLRSCFRAAPGKKFIIMDYSQMELRMLAHLANCTSMIDAFENDADLHSRTALALFPELKGEIEEYRRKDGNGEDAALSDEALVKKLFPQKRGQAKTLNFSVVYGVTKYGLMKMLKMDSLREAQNTIDAWYSEFPEVKKWQEEQLNSATEKGFVLTILGRRRDVGLDFVQESSNSADRSSADLPAVQASEGELSGSSGPDAPQTSESPTTSSQNTPSQKGPPDIWQRRHLERVSINSPVQGSAADVVNVCMVRVEQSDLLQKLGFKTVLQIHDELILEGPAEHAEEATEILKGIAENPLPEIDLRVPLSVSWKVAERWDYMDGDKEREDQRDAEMFLRRMGAG
jgi:DNA polymerase I